jgi:integrase
VKRKVSERGGMAKDRADDEKKRLKHWEFHAMAAEIAAELADEMGDLDVDLARKTLPAVPTVREVRSLLDVTRPEARDHLIMRLLYYTGIRVGELAALCFADVRDDETIFVRRGQRRLGPLRLRRF